MARNIEMSKYGNVLGGTCPIPGCAAAFQQWHACVSTMMKGGADGSDMATQELFSKFVEDHVHDRVVFGPPTYRATYTGKVPFQVILSTVGRVFGPSFTYHRQWLSDDCREWALEFSTDVAGSGKTIRGIDLVSLSEEGRITDFRILAAPPTGVAVLKQEMGDRVPIAMQKMGDALEARAKSKL